MLVTLPIHLDQTIIITITIQDIVMLILTKI